MRRAWTGDAGADADAGGDDGDDGDDGDGDDGDDGGGAAMRIMVLHTRARRPAE